MSLVIRHKDITERGVLDLVMASSMEGLTTIVIERGETKIFRSEPRYDGIHQEAINVDRDAIVFVNGVELPASHTSN